MAESKGVEDLRRGYKAFADNDIDTLTEIIPENAVWHVGGKNPTSGDYQGREAIFGYFGKLAELTGGTFKADLVHVVGDDNYVVALQRTTATVNGKDLDSFDVLVDRMEDDKAVETWVWAQKQYEFDAMLGGG